LAINRTLFDRTTIRELDTHQVLDAVVAQRAAADRCHQQGRGDAEPVDQIAMKLRYGLAAVS
jgi:hypothetical protein